MTAREKFRKKIAIFTVLCMILTLMPAGVFGLEAPDASEHWAKEKINAWMDQGLIKGYEDGTFKPDNNISRAEFMSLVNGAFNYVEAAPISYLDVKGDAWYASVVAKAKAAGYLSGYPDNTIRPNNPISRSEAAAVIMKVNKLQANPNVPADFKDSASLGWSAEAVNAVAAAQIMNGYPDGTFRPKDLIKRAEAVVALDKALTYSKENVTYSEAGVYGPETGLAEINGSVTVTAKGTTLQNMLIKGDLIIGKNVGDGDVTLKNVTVQGETKIYGGGQNSIIILDSTLGKVTVSKEDGKIRIVISGNTTVREVLANSGVKLEEKDLTKGSEGFREIILDASEDDVIILMGSFEKVDVKAEGLEIQIPKGTTVDALTLNEKAKVTGIGTITKANVNASGVTFETAPKSTNVATGVSAPKVGTIPPASGGGGGGGSSSSSVAVSGITFATSPVDTSGLAHDAGAVMVSLATTTDGAEIRYTTDGSTPTAASALYAAPFTVTNPGGIAGGTIAVKAIGIKAGLSNSAVSQRAIVYQAATAVTVNTAAEFVTAIESNSVGTITLGGDISGNVTATRAGTNNLIIHFGTYGLDGNLAVTAANITALTFDGSAIPAITGDLTVSAANATVTNGINVGGAISVADVGDHSWVEEADGNMIILTDSNGATIVITGNPEDITIEDGADGIRITASSPVTITVASGATVNSITAQAAGTTITNNGTVSSVTANADITIENNNGGIAVGGTGTIGTSGTASANVSGTAIVVEGISSALGVSANPIRMGGTVTANVTGVVYDDVAGEYLNVTSADPSIVSINAAGGQAFTAHKPGRTAITVQVKNASHAVIKQGTIFISVLPELISAGSASMAVPVLGATPQTADRKSVV